MTDLKEYVKKSAAYAQESCLTDDFNAMTWLDLELEDNPDSFDCCFEKAWTELNETERGERMIAIRRVL